MYQTPFRKFSFLAAVALVACLSLVSPRPAQCQISQELPADAEALQSQLISDIRQLTLTGQRAGEGYFSQDGRYLVFQSEREPGNPFFQIYRMDRETGDTRRISPGIGKTTCAWIHPDNQRILFASTQYDPEAVAKQKAEIEFRQSGQSRRYSWDYDETFDLVEFDVKTKEYRRLTDELGYDAEGSYSPDGSLICFSSNRRAYSGELSQEERELFEKDPASAIDIYLMNADGTDVRRLTDSIGYDGGPFFSPDGQQICWRRFSRDGATAEIMLMNVDGSNQRQITDLGVLSWAPFFHPSGEVPNFCHQFAWLQQF
jgi:Tol biopolymer transport system component